MPGESQSTDSWELLRRRVRLSTMVLLITRDEIRLGAQLKKIIKDGVSKWYYAI